MIRSSLSVCLSPSTHTPLEGNYGKIITWVLDVASLHPGGWSITTAVTTPPAAFLLARSSGSDGTLLREGEEEEEEDTRVVKSSVGGGSIRAGGIAFLWRLILEHFCCSN